MRMQIAKPWPDGSHAAKPPSCHHPAMSQTGKRFPTAGLPVPLTSRTRTDSTKRKIPYSRTIASATQSQQPRVQHSGSEDAALTPPLTVKVEAQLAKLEQAATPWWSTFCGVTNGIWSGQTAAFDPSSGQYPIHVYHMHLYKFTTQYFETGPHASVNHYAILLMAWQHKEFGDHTVRSTPLPAPCTAFSH